MQFRIRVRTRDPQTTFKFPGVYWKGPVTRWTFLKPLHKNQGLCRQLKLHRCSRHSFMTGAWDFSEHFETVFWDKASIYIWLPDFGWLNGYAGSRSFNSPNLQTDPWHFGGLGATPNEERLFDRAINFGTHKFWWNMFNLDLRSSDFDFGSDMRQHLWQTKKMKVGFHLLLSTMQNLWFQKTMLYSWWQNQAKTRRDSRNLLIPFGTTRNSDGLYVYFQQVS